MINKALFLLNNNEIDSAKSVLKKVISSLKFKVIEYKFIKKLSSVATEEHNEFVFSQVDFALASLQAGFNYIDTNIKEAKKHIMIAIDLLNRLYDKQENLLYPGKAPKQEISTKIDIPHKLAVELKKIPSRMLGKQYKQMESLEEEEFAKYKEQYGYDYAQKAHDLMDDMKQKGANGVGVFDAEKKIQGWVYGYNMTDDEWELEEMPENITMSELVERYGAKRFADVPENFPSILHQKLKQGKVFYVSNLLLKPQYKTSIANMLDTFLSNLRKKGYEYVTFDALSDTFKLFMNPDMTPKQKRFDRFNVQLLGIIPDPDGERVQALAKLI